MATAEDVVNAVRDVVVEKFDVGAVVWFGSSLRNREYSDIDVLVITEADRREVKRTVFRDERVKRLLEQLGKRLDLAVFPLRNVRRLKPFQFIGLFLDGYRIVYAREDIRQALHRTERVLREFEPHITYIKVPVRGRNKPIRIPVYK